MGCPSSSATVPAEGKTRGSALSIGKLGITQNASGRTQEGIVSHSPQGDQLMCATTVYEGVKVHSPAYLSTVFFRTSTH